jgi:DNA-binding NtrC family response regulator
MKMVAQEAAKRSRLPNPRRSCLMPENQKGFMKKRKSALQTRTARGTVFIVDDNIMLVEFAATVLEAAGFKVESFSDPKAVLRAILDSDPKPAVLVTDYDMGDMNGLELIQSSHKVHPALKTVMLSGTADASSLQMHPARVTRFLGKPYEPSQLQNIVAELLRA